MKKSPKRLLNWVVDGPVGLVTFTSELNASIMRQLLGNYNDPFFKFTLRKLSAETQSNEKFSWIYKLLKFLTKNLQQASRSRIFMFKNSQDIKNKF